MKTLKTILAALLISAAAFAQNVGINSDGTAPDASAMLDVKSIEKGMLMPRMSKAQRDDINTPATGLLIFQTDNTPGFYYYTGLAWVAVTSAVSSESDPVFTAWNKSTGISITESQISDLHTYLTAETDPGLVANFDFEGSASGDLLQFNGTKWVKFTPNYVLNSAATAGITAEDIVSWDGKVSSQWTTATNDIYFNSGNVAIGTTSPGAYKLNVAGSINGSSITINGTPVASSTDTYWSTAGAGKIYYSGGNVGIGTATPAYPLDVTGDINISGNFRVNGTPLTGTGTVTSVSAGNGMNFTAVTGSGSVTLGTPSTLTSATTNSVSGTTHAHAITTQLPSSATAGVMLQSGTKTAGGFYGGTTAPTNTTRANYDGYLYATRFYGDGSGLTGISGSTTATNLAGGVAGSIPWQSTAGTTGFTAAGTSGYILKSNGTTAPTWLQTLPIANGGTGATTAAAARTGLGATTLGSNIFTITNPSAITFPRFNADNTVSALNAADFRTAIGAGTGGGSVTSVTGTSPISVATGTSTPVISLGTVPVANGGTGATTAAAARTGLGAAASGANSDITSLTGLSTDLSVAQGGTGASTAAAARTNLAAAASGANSDITSLTGLTTDITVAQGGTGTSNAPVQGGIIYGASTSAMASTAAGTSGQVLTSNGTSAPTWSTFGAVPTGSIMIWPGSTAPTGWLLCDGTAYSTTTYAALYAVLSTTYGSGSGTFRVPDIRGNVVVGLDGTDATFSTRGATGGEKTHILTTTEIPSHSHSEKYYSPTSGKVMGDGDGSINTYPSSTSTTTGNTGGGGSHNNLQPYIVLNYIIKY
jgi:microcystin-dependent protein